MPALQPVISTTDEIQGIASFVDGAGVAFVAFAFTSGARIKVYRVQGMIATPLEDVTPPANSGAYSVALQGQGADLVVTATGHYFTDKPRQNVLWSARYPGVVTRLADPYHGADTSSISVPPAPGPSATDIANAVRDRFITDLGGDTLRHGFGPLVQSATMAAIIEAFKSNGDPVVYAGLRNIVYGVLKDNGLIK